MSGEELARAVRHASWEMGLVSMSAGHASLSPPLVDGHLRKPFGVESLQALFRHYCPRARASERAGKERCEGR